MTSLSETTSSAIESISEIEQADLNRALKNPKALKQSIDAYHIPEEPYHANPNVPDDLVDEKQVKYVSAALMKLESLIAEDEATIDTKSALDESTEAFDGPKKRYLPKLDHLSRTVVTSYSLQAYIRLLPRARSQAVVDHVYNATNETLCKLFRFDDALTLFHADPIEIFHSIIQIARKATPADNDKLNNEIVYLSPGLPYETLPERLRLECGVENVEWISAMQTPFANVDRRLDVGEFEKQLEIDVAHGKVPLLVVAVVGSYFFGHNDLVSKLLEMRSRYSFRLHLIGLNLAALITADTQSHLLKILQSADSFSVPLSTWLGVQGLSHVTISKQVYIDKLNDSELTEGQTEKESLIDVSYKQRLDSLPWWVATVDLGWDTMKKRINDVYAMSHAILKLLSKYSRIEFIGLGSTLTEILNRIEKKSITPPSVLTFKYSPFSANATQDKAKWSAAQIELDVGGSYADCLNVWLAQGLAHDCPWISLQIVDLSPDKLGTAIRCCVLENGARNAYLDKLPSFRKHLESLLNILDVTVSARRRLPTILEDKPSLMAVDIPKWAGVAGLVYLPCMMRQPSDIDQDDVEEEDQTDDNSSRSRRSDVVVTCWTDKQKQQVSMLNMELVHALRNMDVAFSLGETHDGIKCVKFGMIADEHDLLELVDLVAVKGKEIEESSQYMDCLAEIVRQGIETASEDLKKETESRLVNEGVMRQVPLVGSVLNWWSPLPKDQSNMKGRAFNLVTGRILPTDMVFKHKPLDDSSYASGSYVESAEEAEKSS